jgi:hypothetical protein
MNFPNEITGLFSRQIVLGTGQLRVYKNNSLFLTFNQSDISISGSSFTIDVTNMFPDYGDYYILFDTGLFKSYDGSDFGLDDPTVWTFSIIPPLSYYNPTYYNPTKYNT